MLPGTTVVVSPLQALMADQVRGLERRYPGTCLINSSLLQEVRRHARRLALAVVAERRVGRPVPDTTGVGGGLAVPYIGLLTPGMGEAVIIDAFVVAVIGGLTTSTIFTLLALPVWYTTLEDSGKAVRAALPKRA